MGEPAVHPRRDAGGTRRGERRRGSRIPIPGVRCWSPTPAIIRDASRAGLRLESKRPFRRGEAIFLTIQLTGRTGRILGHVRWCRQAPAAAGRAAVFEIGVQLASRLEESWLTALLRPSRAAQPRAS